jgi:hypothetical protein
MLFLSNKGSLIRDSCEISEVNSFFLCEKLQKWDNWRSWDYHLSLPAMLYFNLVFRNTEAQ